MSPSLLSARCLTIFLAVMGLAWGFSILPKSEASDDLRDTQNQLLRSETFAPKTLTRTLESPAFRNLSDCDAPAQIALLLIEARVAEASLRAGAVTDFDRLSKAVESRSDRILACAPRQSFAWLVKFSQAVLRGQLDEQSFNLLFMSYETSPNEAWISIRRNNVAIPLLLVLPERLKEEALTDFRRLMNGDFREEAARLYLAASQAIRPLLQASIEKLEADRQKVFWETVYRIKS